MYKYLLFFLGGFCWSQDGPVMAWNESKKLTWEDFKQQPELEDRAVAITASGITFGFSIKQTEKEVISFTTTVVAHFYPEKSWHKTDADLQVLQHEQLHFDITELFARKLRQRISFLKMSNTIGEQLKKLHVAVNKELANFQNIYDTETDYSRNPEQQTRWNQVIAKELNTLSRFKLLD